MCLREIDLPAGEPVTLRLRKWDGAPHRQQLLTSLGQDDHGQWLTAACGLQVPDPGTSTIVRVAHALLIPHQGWFLAHFNGPPASNLIYADVTTLPELGHDESGWFVAAADMDLDVVRRRDGRIWIDDEDEFAEHAVSYGYPEDVIATTRSTVDSLLAAVRNEVEPFGTIWRDRIR